jgi:NAD(P)-dependent dehydrogenase (short-subunit alcohol dehydrogenase family)
MQDFAGKTALVTGAGSGIGLGIARALAEAGMNLVLADLRAPPLAEARQQIEALGVRAIDVPTDVSDPASVAALADAAEQAFGKLHVAVNNAGVAMHGTPIEQVTPEEWAWVLGVNVMGVVNGIRSFVPLIRKHGEGGHVVNTASISGFFVREGRNQGAYAASKYAVVALSEALEQEAREAGIGVTVLCPGPVRTAIFDSAATRPERFGGAYARPAQEAMKGGMLGAGLDPDAVGRRVVQAIRDGEFYLFTHTAERAIVEARHARISAAFDAAERASIR